MAVPNCAERCGAHRQGHAGAPVTWGTTLPAETSRAGSAHTGPGPGVLHHHQTSLTVRTTSSRRGACARRAFALAPPAELTNVRRVTGRVRPDPDAARSRHARPGSRDRVSETTSQERSDPPHPGPLHGSGRAWGGAYPARLSPPGRDAPGRPAGGGGSRRRQAGLRHGMDRAQTSRPRPPDPGLESPFGGVFRSKSAPGAHVPGFVSLKREAQFPPHHEGCGRRHLCPRRSACGS